MTGKSDPSKDPKAASKKAAADDKPAEELTFEIPQDLTALSDEELNQITDRTKAAVEVMKENAEPTADDLALLTDLATAYKAMTADQDRRNAEREDIQRRYQEQVAGVLDGVATEGEGGEGTDGGEGGDTAGDPPAEVAEQPEVPAGEPVEGELVGVGAGAGTTSHKSLSVTIPATPRRPSLNPPLGEVAQARAEAGYDTGLDRRPELVITAAADVPRYAPGQAIPSMDQLTEATINRAKSLGVTQGAPAFTPLASIERKFELTIDERMHPDAIREAYEGLITPYAGSRAAMEGLVAAGGWCAPSEIRYDFFQISEVAGMWDVPTFGVQRGGLRWPQSLSLSDFFALSGAPASGLSTNATMPWEWTETDDIQAATGTSPTKACLRPPCPSFDEARLRAFGICVLAGNLTQDAFPELIRHFIAQVVVAHARVINRRMILTAVAGSTATSPTVTAAGSPTAALLGGFELNAVDYRQKHGMSDSAVLEGVLPSWVLGLMRSDMAKRNGGDYFANLNIADAQIREFFDTRNIRMQWVQDWQTRLATGIAPIGGTAPVTWPTSVQGLLYAPGTWGRGNGMRLDLGVVRDSVLNADNDHTAAWSEEATLLAKFGHESRVLTFDNLVASGATGQQHALAGA
jgi:hypothetical protein